jgi:GT2 family glycosyltransferase
MAVLDVSVVIPTIGRPDQLRGALESLSRCRPRAEEILVVDQSGGGDVAAVIADFAASGAAHIRSRGRGIGLAMNEGLTSARNEVVLGTHDDCSVAQNWIAQAHRLAAEAPGCIFTGRVLPRGDPAGVPSTKDDPDPYDFTGEIKCDVLYPSNMVLPRSRVLELGGFDERFETAAEDNDLIYRWLKAGRCARYEPALVVWHHDWRTRSELQRLYVRYWRERGRFYAKHLWRADRGVIPFLLTDGKHIVAITRGAVSAAIKGRRPLLSDESRGVFRGFLPGIVAGLGDFRAERSSSRSESARDASSPPIR